MNKIIGTALLIIAGCTLLPGCGASGQTRRLKRMATEYVKEKYDIKAKAGRVSNDGISWLTPIWEKSKAGIVEMKHDGRTFYVHADIDLGVDQCTDNYLEDEFCERIASPFQNISCDDKDIVVAYTEGHYKHLVGKDVKTFDDLIADERIPGIYVFIYSNGLDIDSLSSIDLSDISWLTTVSVYDWTDASLVRSEYKPVSSPYEEQFALKCYAEYNADPSRYPSYFENPEDGKFTVKRFKQIEQGDLLITCGDSDNLEVSEYAGSPESDRQGTTKWYQVTNNGPAATGIIAFPGELADHDKKLVYIERYDGEKTYVSFMGSNMEQDFIRKCYLSRYVLDAGETMICRMVTEDK